MRDSMYVQFRPQYIDIYLAQLNLMNSRTGDREKTYRRSLEYKDYVDVSRKELTNNKSLQIWI